jgi:hypothetical protein
MVGEGGVNVDILIWGFVFDTTLELFWFSVAW